MNEIDIVNDDEEENQTLKPQKGDRKPSGDDPLSDWLLKMYYMLNSHGMIGIKVGICLAPIVAIFLFSIFVSNSTSNLIAFSAMVFSVFFILIAIWILCEILDKDQGTRAMQDVSDPIKEGSEGFFITQYGTIFKLALICSVLLFLVYL